MRTIHKYQLTRPYGEQIIPAGGKVIHAGLDAEGLMPHIWVEFDDSRRGGEDVLRYSIVAIGGGIPTDLDHIASWVDAPYMWHLYGRYGWSSD